MRILHAEDVRRALAMPQAIEAMREAFAALATGRAVVPHRAQLPVAEHDGVTLAMPALVRDPEGGALAVKVISLFDGNAARGLARIQAVVVALDPETGRPAALLEGAALTALRTGAASGLASDLLARPDSRTVAILGAGAQGRSQLEAVCTVRRIESVGVYDPRAGAAAAFAEALAGQGPIPNDIRPAETAQEALAGADIVCTATTSATPVFADADLRRGAHVNAVGSYQPGVQEIPPETVARARVVVDSRDAALEETGDLIQPIAAGVISAGHIHAELGEMVLGRADGRSSADQVTLFKSVGLGVQDALAARAALRNAERLGLGQVVRY